jgi:carbonic anhydrase/SulP family sulfate permease
MIDASDTDYIDPDVLSMIREFKETTAPARDIKVSLQGFRAKYQLLDEIQYADHSTRELLDRVTPQQVLEILREGNRRFRSGQRLSRDFKRQMTTTATEQNPLAVVLSCIDSRVPAELVFDLGLGDIFSVRVAGNVVGTKSLASVEFGVAATGLKLVLVLGHTRCGAVTTSVDLLSRHKDVVQATGSTHLHAIVNEIEHCCSPQDLERFPSLEGTEREAMVNAVAKRNVMRTVQAILHRSDLIRNAVEQGQVLLVGALYDVRSGEIEFFTDEVAEGR